MLAAFLVTGAAAVLAACSGTGDITVLDTTLVTWPGADGATAGQVIVSVRNDADEPVDPDVLGNDRLTLAQLRGPGGAELPRRALRGSSSMPCRTSSVPARRAT